MVDAADGSEPGDEELLRRWVGGEKRAGRQLYRRYHGLVVRFFFNKAGEDTADLVQKTFMAVLEGAARFRGEGSFRSWMLGIAYRMMCKHFEQLRRDGGDVEEFSVADMGTSPSQLAARKQQYRVLLEAMRQLPLGQQTVLELHYWEGLTNRQIAESLQLPIGTVQTRINRARQQLGRSIGHARVQAAARDNDDGDIAQWVQQIRAALGGSPASA